CSSCPLSPTTRPGSSPPSRPNPDSRASPASLRPPPPRSPVQPRRLTCLRPLRLATIPRPPPSHRSA
ncbi:MAG: hypothetical protein AVDCRST_MAG09-2149, partial [uncultured Sphingomonas sp.]